MSFVPLVRIWIVLSVLATVAGWGLSALGQLNRGGYLIFWGASGVLLLLARKRLGLTIPAGWFRWAKIRRRFRRPWPACFALLAFLAFLAGALYPPSTHTAMTYRTPRVLHWLAEEHWYWLWTTEHRMNNRACGLEWLSAPLLLFTRSDRSLFLLNFIPFLLLPGLIYSVFTRLGVRGRVAWQWMWLLPTGYTFLAQAGSAGNDTFPTVYALAAVDFACRAWARQGSGLRPRTRAPKRETLTSVPSPVALESRGVWTDLYYSLLAAALLSGAKASNIPLLLVWGILVLPLLPRLRPKPVTAICMIFLAALVSFLPTAVLNHFYCGDWSGLVLEADVMNMKNPFVGIWGNGFLLLLNNFVPTFFPKAGWWNHSAQQVLPQAIVGPLAANFDRGFEQLWELPSEDWAGIGFGLSVLLLVSVVAALRARRASTCSRTESVRQDSTSGIPTWLRRCALVAPWFALVAYSMKSGMATAARLISPYYPLILPILLIGGGQAWVVRQRWWRGMAAGSLGLAFLVVVLMPGRPLWPAQTLLSAMSSALASFSAQGPPFPPPFSGAGGENPNGQPGGAAAGNNAGPPGSDRGLVDRALNVYRVYGERSDPMASVRDVLPKDLRLVGFLGGPDDVGISLWRPFGQRRVEPLLAYHTPSDIRQRHIEYALVSGDWLAKSGWTPRNYLKWTRADVVAAAQITLRASEAPHPWYVVRFRPAEAGQ